MKRYAQIDFTEQIATGWLSLLYMDSWGWTIHRCSHPQRWPPRSTLPDRGRWQLRPESCLTFFFFFIWWLVAAAMILWSCRGCMPKTAGINVWNGKDRMHSHDIVHDAHLMFGTGGFAQTGAPQTKRLPQLQCWQNDQQQRWWDCWLWCRCLRVGSTMAGRECLWGQLCIHSLEVLPNPLWNLMKQAQHPKTPSTCPVCVHVQERYCNACTVICL